MTVQDQDPTALAAGTLVGGRYRVLRALAQGGMGAVYEAADTRLGERRCALKVLRDASLPPDERAEAAAWFAREAQLLSTLSHPLIPPIGDSFSEGSHHYLVMAFVEGQTLEQALASRGAPGLPVAEVLGWARQLCAVLTYLHSRQPAVIFRDLKPANVMLTPEGTLQLIDFGIARVLEPRRTGQTIHTMIGTPGYSPPEQYQGLADARSDEYSLAATLHHLLSGRDPRLYPPFVFPPLTLSLPDLDPPIAAAIAQALSLLAQDRFPSIQDFEQALMQRTKTPMYSPALRAPSPASGPALAPAAAMPIVSVVPASTQDSRDIAVLTDTPHWPPVCACCCGPADTLFALDYYRGEGAQMKALSWQVPYCSACERHVAAYKGKNALTVFIICIILAVVVLGLMEQVEILPVLLLIGGSAALWRVMRIGAARRLMKSTCGDIGYPVTYHDSSPANEFHFTNQEYADRFAQANQKHLFT